MDGTLIDSMPLWEDCGRAFLSARGITARDDLGETLKSLSMEQTADYLRDAYGISETTAEIIEMINGMVTDAYQRIIPLKRDIAAFLERLRQADVRMCVAMIAWCVYCIDNQNNLIYGTFFFDTGAGH